MIPKCKNCGATFEHGDDFETTDEGVEICPSCNCAAIKYDEKRFAKSEMY